MEKDNSPALPPTSGRSSGFSPSGNASNTFNGETGTGSFGQTLEKNPSGHDIISEMPDNPLRNSVHRRAHSEILIVPDDVGFGSDNGIMGAAGWPSYSTTAEEEFLAMIFDADKFNSFCANSTFQVGESSAAAASAARAAAPVAAPAAAPLAAPAAAPLAVGAGTGMLAGENMSIGVVPSEKPRVRHQHSQSMDGSMSLKPRKLMPGSEELSPADHKKTISTAKLAEIAVNDPKRARRIWSNRQSAARSKERKVRYIAELEQKIQTLQTEATSLSAQLTLLQRDTDGLTSENTDLKLRLETTEEEVLLQRALNYALREQIREIRSTTLQAMQNGPMMNFAPIGAGQPYYPNNHPMHTVLTAQQFQQLQLQNHQLQHQFMPLQLHQLQQQQLQQQQEQLQHQQQQQQQETGEMRVRGSGASTNQADASSDDSSMAGNY